MIEGLEGAGAAAVRLALDAAALRHQAIAHNLANLNSENYVPIGVSFDAQLAAARRTQAQRPELVQESWRGTGPRPQDVDLEMVKLSENTIHYQALLKAFGKQLAILNVALSEGRRA
jgi:flagellar basal-body rod protein FlgB